MKQKQEQEFSEGGLITKYELFLANFRNKLGVPIYFNKIDEMFSQMSKTLLIDFEDIVYAEIHGINTGTDDEKSMKYLSLDDIAYLGNVLINQPDIAIPALRQAVYAIMKDIHHDYAMELKDDFKARIYNVPAHIELPDFSHHDIGKLVTVDAIVTEMDAETHTIHLKTIYQCEGGHLIEMPGRKEPRKCTACKGPTTFEIAESKSDTYQEIRVQQRPDRVKEGRMAGEKKVALIGTDLVNTVSAGAYVRISGIVRLLENLTPSSKYKQGVNDIGDFYIEASHIREVHDIEDIEGLIDSSNEDKIIKEQVKTAIRVGSIYEKEDFEWILASFSPSILGHEIAKEALLYQAVGSNRREFDDGLINRGDINMLIAGSPSSAKSVLGNFGAQINHRYVKPWGEGLTKAGLTAVVDPKTDPPKLRPGACVMADGGGLVIIEEAQSLKEPELRALLEPMDNEQQVTVTRGGIHRILNARAGHLWIMNPRFNSTWDNSKDLIENTGLKAENLARFDLILVFRDEADREKDSAKFDHFTREYSKSRIRTGNKEIDEIARKQMQNIIHQPRTNEEVNASDFSAKRRLHSIKYLKAWRNYVRYHIHPIMTEEAVILLKRFYLNMRENDNRIFTGGRPVDDLSIIQKIPSVTMRQISSLLRLTEASARAHMRNVVTIADAMKAVELVHYSIINSGYNPTTGTAHVIDDLLSEQSKGTPKVTEFDLAQDSRRRKDRWHKESVKHFKTFESRLKGLIIRLCPTCRGSCVQTDGETVIDCTACHGLGCSKDAGDGSQLYEILRQRGVTMDDFNHMLSILVKKGILMYSKKSNMITYPKEFKMRGTLKDSKLWEVGDTVSEDIIDETELHSTEVYETLKELEDAYPLEDIAKMDRELESL